MIDLTTGALLLSIPALAIRLFKKAEMELRAEIQKAGGVIPYLKAERARNAELVEKLKAMTPEERAKWKRDRTMGIHIAP